MVVQNKLVTVEAFEAFIAQHAEQRFELIHGEIVEKVPTEEHGVIAGNIHAPIWFHVKANGLGRVAIEVRHRPAGDRHNDRLPDVSFTSAERALQLVRQGAVPQMPDLAVEVKSPDDSYKMMREKADYYLANGARMVWLVYPEKWLVEVLTPDERLILDENDTLDGGSVLPGFTLAVKAIFEA